MTQSAVQGQVVLVRNALDVIEVPFTAEDISTPSGRYLVRKAIEDIQALDGVRRIEASLKSGKDTVTQMIYEASGWSHAPEGDHDPDSLSALQVVLDRGSQIDPTFQINQIVDQMRENMSAAAQVNGYMVAVELPASWTLPSAQGQNHASRMEASLRRLNGVQAVLAPVNAVERRGESAHLMVLPKADQDLVELRRKIANAAIGVIARAPDLTARVATSHKDIQWFMGENVRVYSTALVSSGNGNFMPVRSLSNSHVAAAELSVPGGIDAKTAATIVDCFGRHAVANGVETDLTVVIGGHRSSLMLSMNGADYTRVNDVLKLALSDARKAHPELIGQGGFLREAGSQDQAPSVRYTVASPVNSI